MLSLGACCAALLGPPLPPRHAASRAGPASMRDYYSVSAADTPLPCPSLPPNQPRASGCCRRSHRVVSCCLRWTSPRSPRLTRGARTRQARLVRGPASCRCRWLARVTTRWTSCPGCSRTASCCSGRAWTTRWPTCLSRSCSTWPTRPPRRTSPSTSTRPEAPAPPHTHAAPEDGRCMRPSSGLLSARGRAARDTASPAVANSTSPADPSPRRPLLPAAAGSVSAGMAIFDTMQYVPCDINTVCFGTAASMGAFLLGAGQKGKRRSLPNSRIMIHQPLGGAQGQAADIEIQAKEILFIRALLCEYIADYTGQPVDKAPPPPLPTPPHTPPPPSSPLAPPPRPFRPSAAPLPCSARAGGGRLRPRLLHDARGGQGLRNYRRGARLKGSHPQRRAARVDGGLRSSLARVEPHLVPTARTPRPPEGSARVRPASAAWAPVAQRPAPCAPRGVAVETRRTTEICRLRRQQRRWAVGRRAGVHASKERKKFWLPAPSAGF